MSKTGAKNITTEYKVYNRVVICKLTFDFDYLTTTSDAFSIYYSRLLEKLHIKNDFHTISIIGKAVCSKSDKFDITTGKRIAESRAKLKMFKLLERIHREASSVLSEALDQILAKNQNCTIGKLRETNRLLCLIR